MNISHRGDGILEAGMKVGVSRDLFCAILLQGGASLVTCINSENRSLKQQAEDLCLTSYLSVIDEVVRHWCMTQSQSHNRRHLALRGYRHFPQISATDVVPDDVAEFFGQLPLYEECVNLFHEAVLRGEVHAVQQNVLCAHFSKNFDPCLANSCSVDSGQPALHKSVLSGHCGLVRLLGEAIVYLKGEHIDSVRDHYGRTGLHYAMALVGGDDIIKVLQHLGASQFTTDKNGETPLSFRDRKDQPSMQQLLYHHKSQNWSEPEPNPWGEALPLPIVSYLSKHHHGVTSHRSAIESLTALSYRTHGHPPLALTDMDTKHTDTSNPSAGSKHNHSPKFAKYKTENANDYAIRNTTHVQQTGYVLDKANTLPMDSRYFDRLNEISESFSRDGENERAHEQSFSSNEESDSSDSDRAFTSRSLVDGLHSWCNIT